MEILINTPIIAEKILKGEFHEIKALMGKSRELGMRTFDWSLFELYNEGHIAYDEAIRNADSANELRLEHQAERHPAGAGAEPDSRGDDDFLSGFHAATSSSSFTKSVNRMSSGARSRPMRTILLHSSGDRLSRSRASLRTTSRKDRRLPVAAL